MPTFNDINSLQRHIKEQVKIALQTQVANKIKELLEQFIQLEVYQSYEPSVYQRTYELLKSVRVGQVKEIKNNIYEVEIYITPDLLGHTTEFGGSSHGYAPTENVRASDVFEWLEQGHYEFWGRPQTYVMEETIKELKRNMIHVKAFIDYLGKNGIKVI